MSGSLVILYATVSGNAEALAELAAARLQAVLAIEVHNVADFPVGRLGDFGTALIVASTWGEGAPPPEAVEFCTALHDHATHRLPRLRYAVFALGSSNYTVFCGCGRRLDEDLAACGAQRLLPRVESDLKFKQAFEQWLDRLAAVLLPQGVQA